jgi:dTDP-4-dehydrorhamnose reductase
MQIQKGITIPELWGGIECTINRVQDCYFDQLDYAGHYHRQGDIAHLAETGMEKIRYPILWEKHQPEKNTSIDWTWTEQQLQDLQSRNIEVIAGFVHHGSGPAFTNLLDEQFPFLLADYAAKVVERFPHINYFTPVNEPLTTARFSGLYGLWYPHKTDDTSFLKMLINELKGIVLAMQAIRKINPQANLVQTEDLGKTYSTKPLQYQADFENQRRWLTYDLLCGRVNKEHPLWRYLLRQNIREQELYFFQENICVPDIFGFNHYLTSERFLDGRLNRYPKHTHGGNGRHAYADVEAVRVNVKEETGISVLLREAWERYRRPMAVTEVHLHCHREEQLRWFRHVWEHCSQLLSEGIQMKAVTAWAMLGSFGWNKLLTEPCGDYEPGVFDVRNGTPRPTALASYLKKLKEEKTHHPLSHDKGWWQRSTRFLYGPAILQQCIELPQEHHGPILVFGKKGSLAKAFARACDERFLHYKLVDQDECNLLDENAIRAAVEKYRPWAILNVTPYTNIEETETEQEACLAINTMGTKNLARVAFACRIKLATFSSAQVFDGGKQLPYAEEDQPRPLNVYGCSMAEAEKIVREESPKTLIIRTGDLFCPWDTSDFAYTISKRLSNEEKVYVASNALFSPTYVPDLVHAALDLLVDNENGIWHLVNNGQLTMADFATEIADRFEFNRKYIDASPANASNYPAKRPLYTVLTSSRGILLPPLEDALRRYTATVKATLQKEKRLLKTVRA